MLLSFVAFALADLADGPTAPPDSTLFREYVFERYVMRRIEHERRKVNAVELSRVYEVLGPAIILRAGIRAIHPIGSSRCWTSSVAVEDVLETGSGEAPNRAV